MDFSAKTPLAAQTLRSIGHRALIVLCRNLVVEKGWSLDIGLDIWSLVFPTPPENP